MKTHNELSLIRENEIRNRLDNIAESLYHDNISAEDLAWSYNTIKDLLFMLYMQKGSVSSRGEPLH